LLRWKHFEFPGATHVTKATALRFAKMAFEADWRPKSARKKGTLAPLHPTPRPTEKPISKDRVASVTDFMTDIMEIARPLPRAVALTDGVNRNTCIDIDTCTDKDTGTYTCTDTGRQADRHIDTM
jgi:hypothetical protein